MLKNAPRILALCLLISPISVHAEPEEGGEMIVAQEIAGQTFHFSDGQMKPSSQAQLEITYRLKDGKLSRSRVYDLIKKAELEDDIVYTVHAKPESPKKGQPLLQATGKSPSGVTELLEIGDTFVQSVRSEGGNLVISRMKRLDTVDLPDLAGAGSSLDAAAVPIDGESVPAPETSTEAATRTPAEQKAYDEGHSSGVSLSETGKFTPFPKGAPANEKEAWFQGFKVGLNEQARKQNENSTALPADAGE